MADDDGRGRLLVRAGKDNRNGGGYDGDRLEAGLGNERSGVREGQSSEVRHCVGGIGRGSGVEQADARRGYALGSGRWSLGDDGLGSRGSGGEFGGDADLKAAAADVDFGGARAESDDGGDVHELRAEALGSLHAPAAADMGSRHRLLRKNAPGRNGGGVEVIAAREFKPMLEGDALGFRGRQAVEVRHGHLTAMDGEPHADQRRGQGDDDEDENLGEHAEESNHATSG